MTQAHRRHDLSDKDWALLEPYLPGQSGRWGRVAKDNRLFINAVFWILRTGTPWRALPPQYGDWKNTHRRFCRWRDKGIWELLLERLIDEPGYEWLIIADHGKDYPPATAGVLRSNQGIERAMGDSTPRYSWPWMRMVCRRETLLRRVPERIALKLRRS